MARRPAPKRIKVVAGIGTDCTLEALDKPGLSKRPGGLNEFCTGGLIGGPAFCASATPAAKRNKPVKNAAPAVFDHMEVFIEILLSARVSVETMAPSGRELTGTRD
jgi:hypothetical protein